MNFYLKLNSFVIFLAIYASAAQSCSNRFEGKQLRAAGDWSALPLWNAVEPFGLLKFDAESCLYTVTVAGLRPDTQYKWKVDNTFFLSTHTSALTNKNKTPFFLNI